MNRREILGAMALVALSGPALAQSAAPAAPAALAGAEQVHAAQTLEAGFVSQETSRIALSKGTDNGVKRFAQAEAAEQQTIATVLKARSGLDDKAQPTLSAQGKASIDKMHDIKTGLEFDRAYVAAQIEGHQNLLRIQETYLADGRDPTSRAIAMLASGHIREHLIVLGIIQKDLAG